MTFRREGCKRALSLPRRFRRGASGSVILRPKAEESRLCCRVEQAPSSFAGAPTGACRTTPKISAEGRAVAAHLWRANPRFSEPRGPTPAKKPSWLPGVAAHHEHSPRNSMPCALARVRGASGPTLPLGADGRQHVNQVGRSVSCFLGSRRRLGAGHRRCRDGTITTAEGKSPLSP